MPQYCVNKNAQPNGDHEVHAQGCAYWPANWNVQDLGWHLDCHSAVQAAKLYYPYSANGCAFCSPACHTG